MNSPAPRDFLLLALSSCLGAWFTYSGGAKLFVGGLDKFTQDVGNYQILSRPWDAAAAYTVPWVEIIVGVCLILGMFRKGALLVLAGLVFVFALAVGWAWVHGLDISCGCHGSDEKLNYWPKTFELTGYLVLIAIMAWLETTSKSRQSVE
jgi:uncharacterized membrane protein YphA (DoxX/SURF4 family)